MIFGRTRWWWWSFFGRIRCFSTRSNRSHIVRVVVGVCFLFGKVADLVERVINYLCLNRHSESDNDRGDDFGRLPFYFGLTGHALVLIRAILPESQPHMDHNIYPKTDSPNVCLFLDSIQLL